MIAPSGLNPACALIAAAGWQCVCRSTLPSTTSRLAIAQQPERIERLRQIVNAHRRRTLSSVDLEARASERSLRNSPPTRPARPGGVAATHCARFPLVAHPRISPTSPAGVSASDT